MFTITKFFDMNVEFRTSINNNNQIKNKKIIFSILKMNDIETQKIVNKNTLTKIISTL